MNRQRESRRRRRRRKKTTKKIEQTIAVEVILEIKMIEENHC